MPQERYTLRHAGGYEAGAAQVNMAFVASLQRACQEFIVDVSRESSSWILLRSMPFRAKSLVRYSESRFKVSCSQLRSPPMSRQIQHFARPSHSEACGPHQPPLFPDAVEPPESTGLDNQGSELGVLLVRGKGDSDLPGYCSWRIS